MLGQQATIRDHRNNPALSVIVPLFNVENFIEDALASLSQQTLRNFEVIVIDDGSTDSSRSVAERFLAGSHLSYRIVSQDNQGVASARNVGLRAACGEYICFLDPDDLLSSDFFEHVYTIAKSEDCDLVISSYTEFTNDDVVIGVEHPNLNRHLAGETEIVSRDEALSRYLFRSITPGVGSVLLLRSLIEATELYFVPGARYSEDMHLIFRAIAVSRKTAITPYAGYFYRTRPGSAMTAITGKRMDGLHLMESLEGFFEANVPSFATCFSQYGAARWVWSTLWQIAAGSVSFGQFEERVGVIDTKAYLQRLENYPDARVRITAKLFQLSPRLYYELINRYVSIRQSRRFD